MINRSSKILGAFALFLVSDAFSMPNGQLYAAVDAGVFQANFSSNYLDQSDVIPQNITEAVFQNGYTGGLALGYTQRVNPHYALGGEISAHVNGDVANYQSGAATAAFSDTLQLKYHYDFTLVSGIITHSSFLPYLKLGVSYAAIRDKLISPIDYVPTITQYDTNINALGFTAGLGVKHLFSQKIALFSEINFHDYGSLLFNNFQNFTADYTHSARLCTYGLSIGAAYTFN